LIAKLLEVEDWLYEDGEDETKGVYISKLEELKKVIPICTELQHCLVYYAHGDFSSCMFVD
jgi:hypothetical protein